MAKVKTSITVDADIFEQVEQLGVDLQLSRSEVYEQALRALVQRVRTETLSTRINDAQDAIKRTAAPEEEELTRFLRRAARKTLDRAPHHRASW